MNDSETSLPEPAAPVDKPQKKKPHPLWRAFWLIFLVASLAYAWHSFYVPSNEVSWASDIDSARELAAETGKPIMLFFTADWCVPCRIMKREVFADTQAMTAINAQVIPVMVYQGEPGADAAFLQYNVKGTPITIFTDPQGAVLDYAVGGIDKAEFLAMLENLKTPSS